jgi:hypothetical protein
MRTFKDDYSFGIQQEDKILPTISKYFNDNIIKSPSKTSRYDYIGTKNYYEVKSRKNNYDAFPTTLIGANKVFTDNQIFIFNFLDGIYYIQYDEKTFETFEKKPFVRRSRCGIVDKEQLYYFIPCGRLTKVVEGGPTTDGSHLTY